MDAFKVLRLNELVLVWLRIYPHQLTVATSVPSKGFFKSISVHYISLNLFAFIVASGAFVYQNLANVMDALRTGTVTFGSGQALGMFLSIGCNIDKVKLLHQKLQAIVDQAAKGSWLFPWWTKTKSKSKNGR